MSSKALQIELLLKCCCLVKWDFIKLKKMTDFRLLMQLSPCADRLCYGSYSSEDPSLFQRLDRIQNEPNERCLGNDKRHILEFASMGLCSLSHPLDTRLYTVIFVAPLAWLVLCRQVQRQASSLEEGRAWIRRKGAPEI